MELGDARTYYQGFPMVGAARAQVWSYAPQYRRPRHFHAEPEFNLIVSGTAWFGVGERQVRVGAGEFLAFAPGQDHVLLDGSEDLQLFAVGVSSDYLEELFPTRPPTLVTLCPVRLPTANFRDLVRRSERYAEQGERNGPVAELWDCLRTVRASALEAPVVSTHASTRRALEALNRDPTLDRERLAGLAGCSPTELSRHFHRDIGVTLVDYRSRLRLLTMIRSVDRGTSNLTSAAVMAGFGSYSQCHRQFLGQLGTTPREFFHGNVRTRMEGSFLPVPRSPSDVPR